MNTFYKYFRALSLDVAIGSAGSSYLFFYLLDLDLPLRARIILPATVWLIYSLDHLLDARNIGHEASTFRHALHQKFFYPILGFAIMVFIFLVIAVFYILPVAVLISGIFLFGLVMLHLYISQKTRSKVSVFLQKEFGVGLIYTLGILTPLTGQNIQHFPGFFYLIALQFFILALANLLEFSYFDFYSDTADQQSSFIRAVGKNKGRTIILALLLFNILSASFGFSFFHKSRIMAVEGCILAMTAILALIIMAENYFAQNEKYRVFGDAIFFIPYLLVLI